ncbi:beta-1,4-glucuronyltransferase 1-like [Hydractinia symbiolongicarpus]|uniref:beta-1,4-glucuronyltransferase 1-like n=1 Tax=Hydractinia symbiolongicarpus TaxID=13093 RepID=UPI002549F0DC|nr:beta-1,4-glucuronyltransferase 1-like [Hydractinia symbiolongicarpus]
MRCFVRNIISYFITFTILILTILWYFYSRKERHSVSVENSGHFSASVKFQQLPESKDGRYKIWHNVWKPNPSNLNVNIAIATQCSRNNLQHVKRLVNYWSGPISIAVLVSGNEIDDYLSELNLLVQCRTTIASQVAFHVVIPLSHPPFQSNLVIKKEDKLTCSQFNVAHKDNAKNYDFVQISYPGNLLRNVALQNIITSHVLVIDVDMLPSPNLREQLLSSSLLESDNIAIVIPSFEVNSEKTIPVDKTELIHYWTQGYIRPFYKSVCWKCQKYTDYDQWKSIGRSYQVSWHDPWEPFYIGRKKRIKYDERFEQYGFNRISQLCEMHMSGSSFHVFHNGYLLHMGFKEKNTFHSRKDEENERNKIIYRKLKSEMLIKYPRSGRYC